MTAPRPPLATYDLTPKELFNAFEAYIAISDLTTCSKILRAEQEWVWED